MWQRTLQVNNRDREPDSPVLASIGRRSLLWLVERLDRRARERASRSQRFLKVPAAGSHKSPNLRSLRVQLASVTGASVAAPWTAESRFLESPHQCRPLE